MVERSPVEAVIPLDELAAAPFPKLVISGGHSAAFDAVCDVLEARLAPSAPCCRAPGIRCRARPATTTCSSSFVERAG